MWMSFSYTRFSFSSVLFPFNLRSFSQHCSSSSFLSFHISRAIVCCLMTPLLLSSLLYNCESCRSQRVGIHGDRLLHFCSIPPLIVSSPSPHLILFFILKEKSRFSPDFFGLAVFKIYSAFHEKVWWKQKRWTFHMPMVFISYFEEWIK